MRRDDCSLLFNNAVGIESGNVVGLRAAKLLAGGSAFHDEVHLMVCEKVEAMFEAGANLMAGGTVSSRPRLASPAS